MSSKIPEEALEALANKQAEEVRTRFLNFAEDIEKIRNWEEEGERTRALNLVDQAIEDHAVAAREMTEKESVSSSYHFLAVHDRALEVLRRLRQVFSSGESFLGPIAIPEPLVCKKEESEPEVELAGVVPAGEEEPSAQDTAVEEIAQAMAVHDRAMEAVERLEKSFSSESEAASDSPCVQGTCACAQSVDESCTPPIMAADAPLSQRDEMQLKKDIVRVMQLAGTSRDGNDAYWALDQLSVGLAKLYPFLGDETLKDAVDSLVKEKVVVPQLSRGGTQFALVDEYAAPRKDEPLEEVILTALRSAKEEGGEYCGWTLNQLIFAVKRSSARLSEKVVRAKVDELIEAGRIVSFQGKNAQYVAIDEETMAFYKEKLFAINHEPDPNAPVEKPAQEAAQEASEAASEPSNGNNGSTKLDSVKEALGANRAQDAVLFSLLSHMRQEPKRLWRGYDIEGLYAASGDNHKTAQLQAALDVLIKMGLVEKILRDSRPGIREDRWGLTELGQTGNL